MAKIYPNPTIQMKLNHLSFKNVHMITDFPTSVYLCVITVTNISQSFYLQDGGKINSYRYGTKLRHYHPIYGRPVCLTAYGRHYTQLLRRLHLVGPYTEINEFYELLLIFENLIKFAGFNKL